jgi:hypothetical protein
MIKKQENKFLTMAPYVFDQTDKGWRSIPGILKKIQAIKKYLQTYAPNDTWLPATPTNKEDISVPFMHWHLGQLYAINDDTEKAITHMEKSIGKFDDQWNDYVNATIMFLKKDRNKFEKYANNENYNNKTIERLRKCFYQSYKEAY